MLFLQLVETSERVAEASRRLAKIELLSTLVRQVNEEEAQIAVAYLSGYTRQGKLAWAGAAIRNSGATPADAATLEILDVDRTFDALAAVQGVVLRLNVASFCAD